MTERKRLKKLVNLNITREIVKDLSPNTRDGLPPYSRFFDCRNTIGRLQRVWVDTPTEEEKKESKEKVPGDNHQQRYINISINNPIVPEIISAGFSECFSHQVARLLIHHRKGSEVSKTLLKGTLVALRLFIETLTKCHPDKKYAINISNLAIDDFIAYREHIEKLSYSFSKKKFTFSVLTHLFSHKSVKIHDQIKGLKSCFLANNNKPNPSLTSPLFVDHTYTDSVMFQLLCQFIYDFDRHIADLKKYENITENELLEESEGEMLRYGDKPVFLAGSRKGISEQKKLLIKWLSDEKYYPIILKHELLWQKIWGTNFYKKKLAFKSDVHTKSFVALVKKYNNWVNSRYVFLNNQTTKTCHRINVPAISCKELLSCGSNQSASRVRNQIGYSLVNLILMATGVNLEIPLSWKSKNNGNSILDADDELFRTKEKKASSQVVIYGFKNKIGSVTSPKIVHVVIPKSSPIYRMLRQYETHVKVDSEGPFFEFSRTFREEWVFSPKRDKTVFQQMYPVYLNNGSLLQSLETRRFRKVFGKTKLFDLMDNTKNAQELAEKIQEAFNHGNLDTTLSSYLLKAADSRNAIDLAIATITSEKINQLRFNGQIDLSGKKKGKKEVYLCECEDPSNPTHEFTTAKECTKYDLCLGCQRSTISAKHLPYICLRIIQYEQMRGNAAVWSAFHEDRWMIAHDALKQYEKSDKKNGVPLVSKAWDTAKNGKVVLPPIIMTEIQ